MDVSLRVWIVVRSFCLAMSTLFLSAGAQALETLTTEAQGVAFVDLSGDIVSNDAVRMTSTILRLAEKHKSDNTALLLRLNSP